MTLSAPPASSALESPPDCPQGHGQMVLRDPKTYTPEQAWCGVWYDCPPAPPGSSCKSSHLLPSPALVAQCEEAQAR